MFRHCLAQTGPVEIRQALLKLEGLYRSNDLLSDVFKISEVERSTEKRE